MQTFPSFASVTHIFSNYYQYHVCVCVCVCLCVFCLVLQDVYDGVLPGSLWAALPGVIRVRWLWSKQHCATQRAAPPPLIDGWMVDGHTEEYINKHWGWIVWPAVFFKCLFVFPPTLWLNVQKIPCYTRMTSSFDWLTVSGGYMKWRGKWIWPKDKRTVLTSAYIWQNEWRRNRFKCTTVTVSRVCDIFTVLHTRGRHPDKTFWQCGRW